MAILTLSVTAAAFIMKSLTDTLISSEKTKRRQREMRTKEEEQWEWARECYSSAPLSCTSLTHHDSVLLTEINRLIIISHLDASLLSIWSVLPSLLSGGGPDLPPLANFYSCPLVQHQTAMNAAGGIINDLTVKHSAPEQWGSAKTTGGERIPRYTHSLTNRSGMAVPFPARRPAPVQIYCLFRRRGETIFS